NIFYETKSNLTKKKLIQLKRAGVMRIQPGIESLSDEVLSLMRKGVKGIHNIQTIKWCLELGIHMNWNFLWGFPGETEHQYSELSKILPSLEHLTPPSVGAQIRLDRFSPLFNDSEKSGLKDVHPYPAYGYIFLKMTNIELSRAAYYFTFSYDDERNVFKYTAQTSQAIHQWQRLNARAELYVMERTPNQAMVFDSRSCRGAPFFLLSGISLTLLESCESAKPRTELVQSLTLGGDTTPPSIRFVNKSLDRLIELKLILELGKMIIALPLKYDDGIQSQEKRELIVATLNELGERNEDGNIRIEHKNVIHLQ
ncbi:MAG: hypothetical protein C0490_27970, partial [Marivirga sp.]|nr:hypothetical protein [Marivirga sp.]